jgi:cell division protein FtsQ
MMFKRSQRRRRQRRRSELRLGAQSIDYQTKPTRSKVSWRPLLDFWQSKGAKLSGLVVLICLGWLAYTLFSSTRFFVYAADIRGNEAVSSYEIYTTSGIDSQSIFWLDPLKIVKRISSLPNIKSAIVSLSLPANVEIKVVERRPELLWQTGETVWWVDQEGTIVPPKQDLRGMLRIIDDDRQALQAGYQIDPTIVAGAQTLRLLAPDVAVIRYSRAQGLMAATPEGWPVYLGDGSDIKAKLVVLTELLADLQARNVKPAFIDMRDPLRPVYRPHNIIQIEQPAVVERPPPPESPPVP